MIWSRTINHAPDERQKSELDRMCVAGVVREREVAKQEGPSPRQLVLAWSFRK